MREGLPIRIWIIDHYAIHPMVPGITRHYSLAKELIKKNHDVMIIASNFQHRLGGSNADIDSGLFIQEKIDNINYLWIQTPSYIGNTVKRFYNMLLFGIRARFNKLLTRRKKKPDVIIGLSPNPFAALAAERLAAHHKVPFILEVRDLWPATLIELGNFSRHHPVIILLKYLERHLHRKARKIITVLPGSVNYFLENGVQKEKIELIQNGIDTDLLPEVTLKARGIPFVIMYTGAHGLANNLETILYCAKILTDDGLGERILFRFFGDGPEKEKLIKLAQTLEVSNVVFENPVPKFKIYEKLAEADALVAVLKKCSLYRWGISLTKLFDYMAMAKPILFGADAFNNPVEDANAGFTVPPENPFALAEAIKKMSKMDDYELQKMGMNGKVYVWQNHSYKNLANKLEGILLQVI